MAHAENEITIDRPAAEVYDFLADGLNNTAWRSGVKDIELASGDAGQLGAVYSQTLTGPRGRPIQGDYRITVAEPGRLLAFNVVAGPARPHGDYILPARSALRRHVRPDRIPPRRSGRCAGELSLQAFDVGAVAKFGGRRHDGGTSGGHGGPERSIKRAALREPEHKSAEKTVASPDRADHRHVRHRQPDQAGL